MEVNTESFGINTFDRKHHEHVRLSNTPQTHEVSPVCSIEALAVLEGLDFSELLEVLCSKRFRDSGQRVARVLELLEISKELARST